MKDSVRIELTPLGECFDVRRGADLSSILAAHGVEFPCGGTGVCGGCRVRVLEGTLQASREDELLFTPGDLAAGWRLACHARVKTPLKLDVGQWSTPILGDNDSPVPSARTGLGIAVDLGTTTIVAQIVDLASGELLGVRSMLNPQAAYGADVMNRVRFAMADQGLAALVRRSIGSLTGDLALGREREISEVIIVGNTVMHHLFAGIDIEPLSHVPFESPKLTEQRFSPQQLGWTWPRSCRIRFLRCLGGFVGSDILAGIVATGMGTSDRPTALIDLGTNGEIAVGNRDRILCASTAAGPAFEAASIKMGMRAASGAIARVLVRGGKLHCSVIGDVGSRGICGSGLVDAVAAGLDTGTILPSGRFANGAREFLLDGAVALYQSDIRELQLAKAAIASGVRILAEHWGASVGDLEAVYLSGAFGNYIRVESARRIGLLEMPAQRVVASGNTALRGAKQILVSDSERLPNAIEHLSLAADPAFHETFADCLQFPEVNSVPPT